ncbi:S8 family serine peptidase [Rhodobacterales bacterium HKCCE2091]|nr:S8 family serine peptidase [Rhodobacterales bacterium HKCCE2091]
MANRFLFREPWLADPGPGFTWRSALALVSACKVSYLPPPAAERLVREDWGLRAQAFSIRDSQGVVVEGDHMVAVAFAGTNSVADWLGNLQVAPRFKPELGGALHRGFLDAYDEVADLVAAAVGRAGPRALWFTGHSLGGALAVIGALTHADRDIAGVMTFGQPRLLGRKPAQRMADRFGASYRRFVNRDDIVTRVPPGYAHTGHRIHFAGGTAEMVGPGPGGVEAIPGPLDEGSGDEELSAAEFVELQMTIDAIEAEIATAPPPGVPGTETLGVPPGAMLDASVEGLVPGVSDHRIDNYLAEVNVRAASEISFEGLHETFLARREGDFARAAAEAPDVPGRPDFGGVEGAGPRPESMGAELPAGGAFLVRLDDPAHWTPPDGVRVRSLVGGIASVLATSAGVQALSRDRAALAIEPSREAGIPELTASIPHVRGGEVHARPDLPERGSAALVGVIDTGIDILHRAFDDADGRSRVQAVWIQWDESGLSPHEVDPDHFSQDYGTLYLAQDIARIRKAFDRDGTPPPRGLRDEFDGHGTHVASIAAGRAFADLCDGMAPEAGIVVVSAHTTRDPDDPGAPHSIGYSASHVDALDFLRKVARGKTRVLTGARPMAINVSLGMNAGAHDGQTTLEAAFDGVTGNGRDPGLVIVKSAGNERGHAGHASQQVALGAFVEIAWQTPVDGRPLDYLEAWFEPGDDVEFTLVTPVGDRIGPVSFDATGGRFDGPHYACRLSLSEGHSDNGHNRLSITVERQPGGRIPAGRWSLEMVARQVVSATAAVHVWAERVRDRAVTFEAPDDALTLSIPGTARSVVTVGACNSAFPMRLDSASSLGLTRDGRPKPEICAPGVDIHAALANGGRDAKVALTGTSMAAPHVTGACALVFSAREKTGQRQVNAVQIQQKLRLTTQNFSHVHNPGFGSGVLDAAAFFDEMT